MNINKLIEGHDEEKMEEIYMDFVSDFSFTEVKEMQKRYAEHYLIKFLDSEIERLEKDKARVNGLTLRGELEHGYILFVEDQIAHLQDIKKQLE